EFGIYEDHTNLNDNFSFVVPNDCSNCLLGNIPDQDTKQFSATSLRDSLLKHSDDNQMKNDAIIIPEEKNVPIKLFPIFETIDPFQFSSSPSIGNSNITTYHFSNIFSNFNGFSEQTLTQKDSLGNETITHTIKRGKDMEKFVTIKKSDGTIITENSKDLISSPQFIKDHENNDINKDKGFLNFLSTLWGKDTKSKCATNQENLIENSTDSGIPVKDKKLKSIFEKFATFY
ncbi:unnamed protein product, partial [Gordionus sp. m RMFG-2023]